MKKYNIQNFSVLFCLLLIMGCSRSVKHSSSLIVDLDAPRTTIRLDQDWRFHLGDLRGGEAADLDDSSWRMLDLPHDWSIEDLGETGSPLDSTAVGAINTGYFQGGTAWYRKQLEVPEELADKRLFLQFDGIYMDADIWINGVQLGMHPYGYTSFWYDISDLLQVGAVNLIAVRVRNEGRNSRWYSGSGIYRHVWLRVSNPVHVSPWGTFVSTPEILADRATVLVSNEIANTHGSKEKLKVLTSILDETGKTVARMENEIETSPDKSFSLSQEIEVPSPELWSIDTPVLYTALTEIQDGKSRVLDRVETHFGIRSIEYTMDGFF